MLGLRCRQRDPMLQERKRQISMDFVPEQGKQATPSILLCHGAGPNEVLFL
jgi:hypothetical protein